MLNFLIERQYHILNLNVCNRSAEASKELSNLLKRIKIAKKGKMVSSQNSEEKTTPEK